MKHILLLFILILPSSIIHSQWKFIPDLSVRKIKKIAQFATEVAERDFPNIPYHLIIGYSYLFKGENYYFVYAMYDQTKCDIFFYFVFVELPEDTGQPSMKVYQKYIEKKTMNINMHHHFFILFQPAVIAYLYEKEKVIVDYIQEIQQYQNCFSIVAKTNTGYDYYAAGWKDQYSSLKDDNIIITAYFKIKN